MNKQRKVLITTTYNKMGIVIDTKAEEVAQPEILACGEGELNVPDTNVGDTISRQAAVDALWKALFKYEDDTEKQFQESDELDLSEWMVHRIFVQNMSDIDRQTILNLPSAQPEQEKYEYHYDHTDCIWYRPEARNRCPATCAQYRDGWNDAMNYIFRDGKGYRPYRRDQKYEG